MLTTAVPEEGMAGPIQASTPRSTTGRRIPAALQMAHKPAAAAAAFVMLPELLALMMCLSVSRQSRSCWKQLCHSCASYGYECLAQPSRASWDCTAAVPQLYRSCVVWL
jgi:hypothetical protein